MRHLALLSLLWLGCVRPSHVERPVDATVPVPEVAEGASEDYRRGAQLYRTASCVGCHSPPFDDAEHLGGGRDLPTIFGLFYAPNISPHPSAGIGAWTEGDFVQAMRNGKSPSGERYWPTFPYMTYTKMSDADLHALWVYLSAQEPSSVPSRPHQVNAPYGFPGMLAMWRGAAFTRGELEPDPTRSAPWNRGRYLVRAVSYCDQCHTPRSSLGLMKRRHDMAGGANPGKSDVHPNLTSDPDVGIGDWGVDEIASYLETGIQPDLSRSDSIMGEKIHDSFSAYSDQDRLAIAVYLKSLPADDFDPNEWSMVKRARRKEARAER